MTTVDAAVSRFGTDAGDGVNGPRAAPPHFQLTGHRSMAEVMLSERIEASHRRLTGAQNHERERNHA